MTNFLYRCGQIIGRENKGGTVSKKQDTMADVSLQVSTTNGKLIYSMLSTTCRCHDHTMNMKSISIQVFNITYMTFFQSHAFRVN